MDIYGGFPDPNLHKTSDPNSESISKRTKKNVIGGSKLEKKIDLLIKDEPLSFLQKASSYASNLGEFLFGKKVTTHLSNENEETSEKIIEIKEKSEIHGFEDQEPSFSPVSIFIDLYDGQEALEKLTGHHDDSLIKEFNSQETTEKELEQVFEEMKESSSDTEKLQGFGKMVGILIETIPTSIHAIETGEAVIFDRFFKASLDLFGIKGNLGTEAGKLVLLTLLSTKIDARVEFYEDKLLALQKTNGSEKEIIKLKLKIGKLQKYRIRTFSKIKIDTLLTNTGVLAKAVETITPLLPKSQETFKNICDIGNPILNVIRIAADSIMIKQRREALELMHDMKAALNKEKEFLLKGDQSKKTIEKILSLEKEIKIIEEKIIYQEFRFTSKSIDLIRTLIGKITLLLPGDANLFLKLGTSLSIINNAVDIGLPGRAVIQSMQKISDLRKQGESLDIQCNTLHDDIEIIRKSQSKSDEEKQIKIKAKENLLKVLQIKKAAIDASIRNHVFGMTQNLVLLSNSSTSLSKDALVLLGLGKAVSIALGGIGTALLAANIFLTIAKYTYVDTSSIERWVDQRVLNTESKQLQNEISLFHSRIKALSEEFMDLKEIPIELIIERCRQQMLRNENEIEEHYKNINTSDNQEMKNMGKEIIMLQNEQNLLLSLCTHIQDLKTETVKPTELILIKQKLMNQFTDMQMRVFGSESKQLKRKEAEIEKDFLLNRKLRPLGLNQEGYSQFKNDLKKVLADGATYKEFSKYVKKEDRELWDKIFAIDQEMNVDLLTDFFIPPIG